MIVFALLMAVVVISAWRDSHHARALCRIAWPTAVGDETFYVPDSGPFTLTASGQFLILKEDGGERLQIRDDQMWRLPLAVSTLRIYSTGERIPADAVPALFVKIAHGEYLKMRLEPLSGGGAG